MITIEQLKKFAIGTNIEKKVNELLPIHWIYAKYLVSHMREDTEQEMNRVWTRMPRNLKPSLDDKKARLIPELISRFITVHRKDMMEVFIMWVLDDDSETWHPITVLSNRQDAEEFMHEHEETYVYTNVTVKKPST
jgi:hypothetical protein